MAEFDDKLNSLLSDPNAMDQIMKMAQSLMGGMQSGAPSAGGAENAPGFGAGAASVTSGQGGENDGSPPFGASRQGWGSPPPDHGGGWGGQFGGSGGADPLSGLGGMDPKTMAALLPILRELGSTQNSSARQLLFALRPYLKPERQDKVERALQLARLFRVGKRFLLKGDGHV